MIVSAEFDPLRDEAGAFAHRIVSDAALQQHGP
jgi:hypothetical protein